MASVREILVGIYSPSFPKLVSSVVLSLGLALLIILKVFNMQVFDINLYDFWDKGTWKSGVILGLIAAFSGNKLGTSFNNVLSGALPRASAPERAASG
jgi:hypothetical protein